eukprot:2346454-Rhodomonas_salina.2
MFIRSISNALWESRCGMCISWPTTDAACAGGIVNPRTRRNLWARQVPRRGKTCDPASWHSTSAVARRYDGNKGALTVMGFRRSGRLGEGQRGGR